MNIKHELNEHEHDINEHGAMHDAVCFQILQKHLAKVLFLKNSRLNLQLNGFKIGNLVCVYKKCKECVVRGALPYVSDRQAGAGAGSSSSSAHSASRMVSHSRAPPAARFFSIRHFVTLLCFSSSYKAKRHHNIHYLIILQLNYL